MALKRWCRRIFLRLGTKFLAWTRDPVAISLGSLLVAIAALILPLIINSLQSVRAAEAAANGSAQELAEQRRSNDMTQELLDRLAQPALRGANPDPAGQAISPKEEMCSNDGKSIPVGWGPNRPIFEDEVTPPYALFNSVRDNQDLGDERSFYAVKDASDLKAGGWQKTVEVQKGHTYLLRIYVRNDSSYPKATAGGAKVMVNLPTCAGTTIGTGAFISSPDAYPDTVYDGVKLVSDTLFNLAYVENSAVIYSNSPNSPFRLTSTDLFTSTGQPIGSDSLDGNLQPGHGSSLYLSFEVKPQFAP